MSKKISSFAEALFEGLRHSVFKNYIGDFKKKRLLLDAKRRTMLDAIEEAKDRNETQVQEDVQNWINQASKSLEEVKTIKRLFGVYPDFIWLLQQEKDMTKLIERCDHFGRVARRMELPGIKYYSSQKFICFESIESEFDDLLAALKDEDCSMIGLYGMGGTGKTTLALHVGIQVENDKLFDKVIFVEVSSPPDIKKIQFNIASQLSLELGEGKEEVYSQILWTKMANGKERILIILDGMWEKLNLLDIGIPYGPNHRNCCVLITTRHLKVCKAMECQLTIRLQTLTDPDALILFVEHVLERSDDPINEFMQYAQEIVRECEGLPDAVVAIATGLKILPLKDWKIALETLQHSKPLHKLDEDITKVYQRLKLSYDGHEKSAKDVFLLCSLFPKGYEIPIDLLCKLSIGLGLFEEAYNYLAARRKAIEVKDSLISSSLLCEAKKAYVKMHNMVRGMALWAPDTGLQVIMDSRTTVKSHIRFLFWSRDEFPNRFDGTKLELQILVLWIKGKVRVEDSYTIFQEMAALRVLFLLCDNDHKCVTLSLKLLHSLKNIRTLILDGWKLSDISLLKILHGIEILQFTNCLINELPNEIRELKNLRSLGLRKCKIERNNPFEVIERCTQLEELDFVLNSNIEDWKEEGERENIDYVIPDVSPPTLTRYSIACPHLKYFEHDDNGMLNCFNSENVRNLISNAMFKKIVRTVEVLELGETGDAGWKSIVPDIINPVEDGGMDDLIKLCLYSLVDMECLVDTNNHYPDMAVFSNLDELYLDGVDVKELYRGPMLSGFLGRLQILKLRNCKKLRNIFSDSNMKLPHLKVLHLINCPMFQSSMFQSYVAQSLEQLQELIISDFEELNRVITYESMGEEIVDAGNKNSHGTLFPNLKTLEIKECGKLELISPLFYAEDLPLLEALIIRKCEGLKCIFGEYRGREYRVSHQGIELPSMTKMILDDVPNFITIFQECNIDMKRGTEEKNDLIIARRAAFSSAHGDNEIFNASLQDHTISPELPVSMKGIQTFHPAQCLLRGTFKLQNIRQMTIVQCSNLMSLFTLSIATTVMLEKLTIQRCDKLKHLITNEKDDDNHMDSNYNSISIFPKLEKLLIVDCSTMESIFPSTSSVSLQKLKFVIIGAAPKLKYVFGRFGQPEEYLSNEKENEALYIGLPALETLSLTDVPNIISFCKSGRQLNLETTKKLPASMKAIQTFHTAQCLLRPPLNPKNIRQMTIVQCSNLMSLFTVSIAKSVKLEKLTIQRCDKLKHVMTKEEENHDDTHYISIFPELEELLIVDCRNIESIFLSTSSARLRKLKYVIIRAAPKLKYVFGRFGRGKFLSNENENKEPYIDVPALETISLTNVPNIIGICTNGKQLSSEKAMNLTSQGAVKSEIEEIIEDQRPMTSIVSTYVVSFQNVRDIKIIECRKIKAMFPASTWRSLSQLCKLCILNCEELVHLVDEDLQNCSLPKLEYLQIQNCNKLEFVFPSSFLGGLPKLKSMIVEKVAVLTYIFGDYLSNENQNGRLDGDLSALERLSLRDVPNIIAICAKRYFVRFPSLQLIGLDNCQLTRDSLNLMVYWKPAEDAMKFRMAERKLTNLEIGNSTIDEVFNLEGVKIGEKVRFSLQSVVLKNLSELKQMCKGPDRILNLYNLRSLKVIGCKRLRAIFSISILKSFPHLSHLKIKDCEELVHIIEEDPKESAADDWQRLSFPKLENVHIQSCDSLKFIFSISTPNMFPMLERLEIEEASELEQIFTWNQDVTQKIMVAKDVFPNLTYLILIKLPKLVTVGCGIGFQTLPDYQVVDCPKYQEITSQQVQQDSQNLGLDNQSATEALSYTGERSPLRNSAEPSEPPQHVSPRYWRKRLEEYAKMAISHGNQLPVTIKFESEIYGQDSEQIIINELINEILKHEVVSTSAINLYIRYLHKQFLVPSGLSESFRFISPHVVASHAQEMKGEILDEQSRDVALSFITNAKAKDTLFLVPYLQGGHWILIVINPKMPEIWYLDPLHGQASNRKEMQELFNKALLMYREKANLYCPPLKDGRWDSIWKWKETKCPRQRDRSLDCVFCIMKFMKDIVVHKLNTIPDKYYDDTYCTEYSFAQIEEVIEELAMTVHSQWSESKLKDEQTMMEPIGKLQYQYLGETKTTVEVPQKPNIPLDDDSTDAISKEIFQESRTPEDVEDLSKTKPRSETIMTPQQEQGEISASVIENIGRETGIMEPKRHNSTTYSEEGGSESCPSPIVGLETGKVIDKAVPVTVETTKNSEVDGLKETEEQGFLGPYKSKDIVAIQQKSLGLRTQSGLLSDISIARELSQNHETGKQVVGIAVASEASVTTTSSNSKVDSVKETMGQSFQQHDASLEATIATHSADLEPRKQSKESSVISQSSKSGKEAGGIRVTSQPSMFTSSTNSEGNKEAARKSVDTSPMEDAPFDSAFEQKLEDISKPNLPNVIPSFDHESPQILTSSPPTLEILEIFQLVELKDGEGALLARALEKYPQLLLPRQQQIRGTIAFSYRVLVDILVVLATKTPCTITTSEKSTLDNNLYGAALLGFDKSWIDSVRAKVFEVDMSVTSAQENIRVMEAKLETCGVRLKQVQKEKEQARRHLEVINSELSDLLKDQETLMTNMSKSRDIIRAKDTPYGI